MKQFLLAFYLVIASVAQGQTLNVLYSFTNTPDGQGPSGGLIISGNKLYGTTTEGGSNSLGIVFSLNTDGSGETTLHSFTADPSGTNSDGAIPWAGLVVAGDTIFGTTRDGGPHGGGTLFSLKTDGSQFTVLHGFTNGISDGCFPSYNQNLALSGNTLYGSTANGGNKGNGTIYSILTNGTGYMKLINFTNIGGSLPFMGAVSNGKIYGTCYSGGPLTNGGGVVFSMNTDGSGFKILHGFATLHFANSIFTNADGAWPEGLVLSGNTLYGNCAVGNTNGSGILFSINTDGSWFTIIHAFDTGVNNINDDGEQIYDRLTLAGDTLYGVAQGGGANGGGTLFNLQTNGTAFTILYTAGINMSNITFLGGSLAFEQGIFYGTGSGGSAGSGAVFSLNTTPQFQTGASNLGVQTNQFGFSLSGYSNQVIIVEASTNMTGSNWQPVQTNTLTSGSSYFSDPQWTNYPGRFYRLRSP
jgi:uncharacterized repeat protein (TIGR03803 family)